MKKYFCDKCEKETKDNLEIKLKSSAEQPDGYFELCEECYGGMFEQMSASAIMRNVERVLKNEK